MTPDTDLDGLDQRIQTLKATALELRRLGERIPAVAKNADRILASVAMLEINISDVVAVR